MAYRNLRTAKVFFIAYEEISKGNFQYRAIRIDMEEEYGILTMCYEYMETSKNLNVVRETNEDEIALYKSTSKYYTKVVLTKNVHNSKKKIADMTRHFILKTGPFAPK